MSPPPVPPSQGQNVRKIRDSTNVRSYSLTDEENEIIFNSIGNRCVTLATAVTQVYLAEPPSRHRWNKRCCGVACFIKDNGKRSYYIRIYNIKKRALIWEQEIYNQFKYNVPRPYFHTFEAQDAQAGLNFCNVEDANNFRSVIENKLEEKNRRKTIRKQAIEKQKTTSPPAALPVSLSAMNQQPTSENKNAQLTKKEKKVKKGKKPKICKEDIGMPTAFQHLSHMGYDSNKELEARNVDPDMKKLLESIGYGNDDVDDATQDFIYDFVEKHGGLEAVKKEIQSRPPPPAPVNKAPPRRPSAALPPPPSTAPIQNSRSGPAPPPPQRNRSMPTPPLPPNTRPAAVPPPPPPHASHRPAAPAPKTDIIAPPPPPLPTDIPAPPPMSMGRANLLSDIQKGVQLDHVSEESKNAPKQSGGRDDLLSAIRKGMVLNPTSTRETVPNEKPPPQDSGGIAGALAKALANRQKQIMGSDDDSNSDDDDDDDEEDEWDD